MEFEVKSNQLIEELRQHGIRERVLGAMKSVHRHLFVPEREQENAYGDYPLMIGFNQTISAPHMVAIMCDLLDIRDGMKVLEIGAGSGYHAAVMAVLAGSGHVYTVERIEPLALLARQNLKKAGIENVTVIVGDGSLGLPEYAPYDRISVAAASPEILDTLTDQLKIGGKLIIPVGKNYQELYLVTKTDGLKKEVKGDVVFVPLVGKKGF
ncbi:MAG: protein-L-isoaspartate O-methyltransferase [Candidatus Methanoperedens nitroreducens]|uniref:Protein-L-isoaspartate O-methyltransferase n=1 Tax=Candidatus Methanoperedens nitratireducens TaxID=1392998 RepID=A0A0P7ZAL0_9EURY|nr:protein-L-isoaspartate(D-aspartate) O-methyltransferase [Candidatus Methanoperedens sp. BLZ2]KAB2947738.1 MAG: protein-L-isoaspartate(D-aspartate) O-methyltransferase [Candidatus Methanoperedens sp.]KPQ41539.1 MAG: protein-L-isoaspartate O-methyltransferase [Candidatus Methanoperedens sp. BLZ1]MBZ0176197.1 protein-L-isoaspartate(D-aspartate) O-methyltransferase [Candidatus Methanoperedens nitroreducens]MCX9077424.1 protein-L-isoaspartate(D-aspartate) O-methyltransferase [Candidatus Methanope